MNSRDGKNPELRTSKQYVAKNRIDKLWKRSMLMAHAGTQAVDYKEASEGKAALPRAVDYLKIMVFGWVWHYLKNRFGPKWDFPWYTDVGVDNGIYDLTAGAENANPAEPVLVSLIGDWGTGTEEAHSIAEQVKQDSPHFTIHLGDIYYVGAKEEVQANMFGKNTGVEWPTGSLGSFALNANHEMYARGIGYFEYLLPALGMKDGREQKASFFCLRNDHWLVIGLDTGYYSVGVPVIEMVFKANARLHAKLLDWLREVVRLPEDHQRGVVLLSHHQYYSQFESGYERAAEQISQLIERPVLWFWGHEHRFAIYGKQATKMGKLQAYGRCIGHGGLPIEDIGGQPKQGQKYQVGLVLYDRRERAKIGALQIPVGYNGYANLRFEGKRLTVEYKDAVEALVRESWQIGDGGLLKWISMDKLISNPDLVLYEAPTLDAASA